MSFLTNTPDLAGTIFTDEDLRIAREYLASGIASEYPAWLKKPQGILGEYWRRDDTYATCFLIDVARTIYLLDQRVSDRSIPRLYAKVHGLLRPPSLRQFVEMLTELQVGGILAERASPIYLLESEDIIEPKVTRAPDFALQLPDGFGFVETSVFHGGILDTWSQAVQCLKTKLQEYLFKHNRMLSVRVSLPLKLELDCERTMSLVVPIISKAEVGRVQVGNKGIIEWEPLPIITDEDSDSLPAELSSPFAVVRSPGAVVDRAFASQTQIVFATEQDGHQAKEAVLRGLRQKLREKHAQFLPETEREPSILVMRIEHYQLGAGDILAMLEERIWPNKEAYDWLTGVALFQPRQGFQTSDKSMGLHLFLNPHTNRPMTESMLALFNGAKTFLSDWSAKTG